MFERQAGQSSMQCVRGVGTIRRQAEAPLDLASPTAAPTTTTARPRPRSGTPNIRSPGPDPPWRPWSPDTRRAGDWDIDVEVDVGVDDVGDPNR
jgi:hypothetical protein